MQKIVWKSFPFGEDFPRSILVILLLVGLGGLVYLSFRDLFLGIFTTLILFFSLLKYFFPTTYILAEEELVISFLGRQASKPWSFYRDFEHGKNGVYLSHYKKGTPGYRFFGTFLRFKNNREVVINFLKERIIVDEKVPNQTQRNYK
jgi:hypothetical protein